MNDETLCNLRNILDYLQDQEVTHFQEQCECDIELKTEKDFKECKCRPNKHHILKDIFSVRAWMDGDW